MNTIRLNAVRLNTTRLNTTGIGIGKKGGNIPTDNTADLLTETGGFFRLEAGGKMLLESASMR